MRTIDDSIYVDIMGIGSQSNYGVFIYDLLKKNFVYTNRKFTEIFRVTDESLKEQSENVLRYVLTEDQEYLQARLNEIMESGSIDTTEFRLEFDDNSVLHLACDAFLITGFVKDITREKEHENYVIEITAQKDAFLDMITHNLSGPLTMSQNLLSWVQRSVDAGDTKMNGLLVMLQDSTQQCIDIVNDFLKDEHRDSQTIFVRKTRFDIVDKINVVLEKLKDFTPGKTFEQNINVNNVNINTDSVKFFQVVHNLITLSSSLAKAVSLPFLLMKKRDIICSAWPIMALAFLLNCSPIFSISGQLQAVLVCREKDRMV